MIICGQCSVGLKAELEGGDGYAEDKIGQDKIKLLKVIKGFYCQFNSKIQRMMAIVEVLKILFLLLKGKEQTNEDYDQEFKARVKTIERCGGMGTTTHVPVSIKTQVKMFEVNTNRRSKPNEEWTDKAAQEELLVWIILSFTNFMR